MSRVLVIGGGLAGLQAAIAAAERGARVLLASKVHPLASHSIAATGGINAALAPGDSWEDHARDTVKAGAGLADLDAVEKVCRGAGDEVRRVEGWGVPFNRDAEGRLEAKPIGGTSRARTLFAGEHTGKAVLQALWQRALRLGVELMPDAFLTRLVSAGGRCRGAVLLDLQSGQVTGVEAGAVVIATGGLGRLYGPTTNAAICTGDGQAAALRAGAALRDMEMTQFYPTCLPGSGALLTEEVRTRGALLINDRGERFMARYAPEAMEMAGRDVLSRALFAELAAGRRVFLDCRPVGHEELTVRLRAFHGLMLGMTGVDVTREPVEVMPAFHYQMGGIATDIEARTNVPGLLAAGECACVSLHGGNRIGANSLLETLVMGRTAGLSAVAEAERVDAAGAAVEEAARAEADRIARLRARPGDGREVAALADRMRAVMAADVGIIRTEEALARATAALESLGAEVAAAGPGDDAPQMNLALRRLCELENLLLLGRAVVASARARHESRGAHYRSDHPVLADQALHTEVSLGDGGALRLERAPVRGSAGGPS